MGLSRVRRNSHDGWQVRGRLSFEFEISWILILERIALQGWLRFEHFDAQLAWTLGTRLKAAAEERRVAVAIDIQLHGQPLFLRHAGHYSKQRGWDSSQAKRTDALSS